MRPDEIALYARESREISEIFATTADLLETLYPAEPSANAPEMEAIPEDGEPMESDDTPEDAGFPESGDLPEDEAFPEESGADYGGADSDGAEDGE